MIRLFGARSSSVVDAFFSLCKTYPFERKFWITNKIVSVQAFLHQLSRCGGSWVNVVALSPLDWAKFFFFEKKGFQYILSHDQQLFILKSLLDDLYRKKALKILPFWNCPISFLEQFLEWMSLETHSLEIFKSSEKVFFDQGFEKKDLKLLMRVYRQFLKNNTIFDRNDCTLFFKNILEDDTKNGLSEVFFHDEEEVFDPCFQDTFLRLPQKKLDGVGQKMLLKKKTVSDAQTIFSISYNVWCEIHAALDFFIEKEIPWDTVEIFLPEGDLYLSLTKSICSEYGVPVIHEDGRSLLETHVGKFFQCLLDFFEQDADQKIVISLFRNHLIAIPSTLSVEKIEEFLMGLTVGWGKKRWDFFLKQSMRHRSAEGLFVKNFVKDIIELMQFYKSGSEIFVEDALLSLIAVVKKYVVQNSPEKKEEASIFFGDSQKNVS